jgi:hypothetical protein
MKLRATALIFLATVFLFSCCTSKKIISSDQNWEPGESYVVAVYKKPDTTKDIAIMLRFVSKNVKYDSLKKKDLIVVDTVWGRPVFLPALDSVTRQPVLDPVTKKPKLNSYVSYLFIRKDSVRWWGITGTPTSKLLTEPF